MSPSVHAVVSVGVAVVVWRIFDSWQAGLASAVAGFFIDIDHVFDYVMAGKKSWKIRDFFNFYQGFNEKHIYVPLHGWEYVFLFCTLAYSGVWPEWMIGLALGWGHHLLLDQLNNGFRWDGYTLFRRISTGFKSEMIVREKNR